MKINSKKCVNLYVICVEKRSGLKYIKRIGCFSVGKVAPAYLLDEQPDKTKYRTIFKDGCTSRRKNQRGQGKWGELAE